MTQMNDEERRCPVCQGGLPLVNSGGYCCFEHRRYGELKQEYVRYRKALEKIANKPRPDHEEEGLTCAKAIADAALLHPDQDEQRANAWALTESPEARRKTEVAE